MFASSECINPRKKLQVKQIMPALEEENGRNKALKSFFFFLVMLSLANLAIFLKNSYAMNCVYFSILKHFKKHARFIWSLYCILKCLVFQKYCCSNFDIQLVMDQPLG